MLSVKIAIAEDHEVLRNAMVSLLESNDKINIKVEIIAPNGFELLRALEEKTVELIILDLRMPVMDGFETLEVLKRLYPGLKIIVCSSMTDDFTRNKVALLGAHGFVPKSEPEELLSLIAMLASDT